MTHENETSGGVGSTGGSAFPPPHFMTAEEVASALDQECVRLRKALELERIENLKLQQDATLFDFEMFVVAQERRIRECLSPNTRDDQRENPQ